MLIPVCHPDPANTCLPQWSALPFVDFLPWLLKEELAFCHKFHTQISTIIYEFIKAIGFLYKCFLLFSDLIRFQYFIDCCTQRNKSSAVEIGPLKYHNQRIWVKSKKRSEDPYARVWRAGTGNSWYREFLVPGIFHYYYRNRYRKKLVPQKSLGTGIG